MFLAARFGLVALIANGYRLLAAMFLLVYVLPVLTIGIYRLWRGATPRKPHEDNHSRGSPRHAQLPWPPAAPPKDFAQRVESVRTCRIGVPGMAIAIVEGDTGDLRPGLWCQGPRQSDKVDADTIFPTGSTGKAFTVAALGILVDQGKIGWDDKVIDRLPGFQMYDPWVTREMTIRDLLVHRSGLGLGAGDLLFVPRTNLTRAESVRRLRYIKPATSFRSGFAYDNVLYMVAGQLIESVTGKTWEQFMTEHVLRPGRHAALPRPMPVALCRSQPRAAACAHGRRVPRRRPPGDAG